jgi:hypothetical protein
VITLLAALFLLPGPVNPQGAYTLQFSGPSLSPPWQHTRWRAGNAQGEWTPPQFTPPAKGAYWISAAVKAKLQTLDAKAANTWAQEEGLNVILDYRRQYKMQDKSLRILTATYAKTLLLAGGTPNFPAPSLNLPVELVLLNPTTLEVRFRGKPIADIQIKRDGKVLGRSNGMGQLVIAPGAGRLEGTVVRPYPDRAEAEWEAFTATLLLP